MTTQTHTPGPWHAGGTTVYGGGVARLIVASTTCRGLLTRGEDEANARLIAAAPDMLAALEETLAAYVALRADIHATIGAGAVSQEDAAEAVRIKHAARSAIAKAKGEA